MSRVLAGRLARSRSVALATAAVAMSLVLTAFALIVLGGPGEVPDNWGFRGYFALFAALFIGPGLAIELRRPGHPIGWMLLWIGLCAGLSGAMQEYVLFGVVLHPGALPFVLVPAWVASWFWLLSIGSVFFLLMLFPDGRLRSPRWRWAAAAVMIFIAIAIVSFAFRPGPLENAVEVDNPLAATGRFAAPATALSAIAAVWFVLAAAIAAAAPVARYWRASSEQRQQLKWFALSGAILAVAAIILIASNTSKVGQIAVILALGSVPISVAIAVLRYRLYDVDVLINRTIVYGATIGTMAVGFVGAALFLQTLLRPFTSGSDLAVAVSTLATVAAFQPLRRRIQGGIDRRFYRSRYDAARTLDLFTSRLRDEVDLDHVSNDLLNVVSDTVRPAHASVWLRMRA